MKEALSSALLEFVFQYHQAYDDPDARRVAYEILLGCLENEGLISSMDENPCKGDDPTFDAVWEEMCVLPYEDTEEEVSEE